jgi:PST family polysaccharide transporter
MGGVVARGGIVAGSAGLIENGAQFVRALVLARLLSPEDFGLMGMAFVFAQASESMSQTGLYTALVQKREDIEGYLDTVWTVSVLRGIALFVLLWLAAPLIGMFFTTPAVVPIVRGVAFAFLAPGFTNPGLCILEKELHFARFAIPTVIGTIADLIVTISFALVYRNVWAMVFGFVVGKTVAVIASFAVRPYLPRVRIRKAQAVELYRYGRHISRAMAGDYIVSQLDRILVGRLLGADPLGLYSFASRLANLPTTAAYRVVFSVALPVFSRVQEEPSRVRAGFVRAVGMMTALMAPISAGVFAVAPDLVPLAFGEKWVPMVPALRILCAAGAFVSLSQLIGAFVRGVGRPELGAHATYLQLGFLAVTIYPAVRAFGIVGAGWCVMIDAFIGAAYLLIHAARVAGSPLREVTRTLAPSVIASVVMLTVLVAGREGHAGPAEWKVLVTEIVSGATLYFILAIPLDRILGAGLLPSIRSMWRRT